MKLRLSDAARWDLQDIANYTWSVWGEEQERKYLTLLYHTLEQVALDPTRSREREELYQGCRVVFAGKHAIFFKLQDDSVCVARILHQAMDYSRHLP